MGKAGRRAGRVVSGSGKIPPEAMAAADEYLDVLYDGRNWRESFWPAGK